MRFVLDPLLRDWRPSFVYRDLSRCLSWAMGKRERERDTSGGMLLLLAGG